MISGKIIITESIEHIILVFFSSSQVTVSDCFASALEPVPDPAFNMVEFPLLKSQVLNAICAFCGLFDNTAYDLTASVSVVLHFQ